MGYPSYIVDNANGKLHNVEKSEKPEPQAGHVRIKVHACGICHSDTVVVMGLMPCSYPRSPGHEIAGEIDAVGEGVKKFKEGDRVGVGWYGGHCNECRQCDEGDFMVCTKLSVTGLAFDGGYSEYVVAPVDAVAAIPDNLSFVEAAPLLCAGVTTFNSLRRSGALPGDNVAIQGVGGLGHLAIQFANKMGFKVIVLSRGKDKKELAMKLGGHVYLDTNDADFQNEVEKLGGVKVLIASSTSGKAMAQALPTLSPNGTLVVLGVSGETIEVDGIFLLSGRRKVLGFPSGTAADSFDCLKMASLHGVRSMNEVYPVSKLPEAYERMLSGDSRFRVVVDYDQK